MHQRSDVLSVHHLLEVAHDVHIEHIDRQVVLLAHCSGGKVHYLQSASVNLIVCDVAELCCCGGFLRVGCIYTIHTGSIKLHVCLNLDTSERRTGICCEIWATSSGREDTNISCLHCLDSLPLGVELPARFHADGSEHLCFHSDSSKSRTQRE